MFDPSKRLFPCMILADTAVRAHGRAHLIAIVATAFVGLTLWKLKVSMFGFTPAAFAVAATVYNFRPNQRNHVSDFMQILSFHIGHHHSDPKIEPPGPWWLAVPLIVVLSLGIVQGARPFILYVGLGCWYWLLWKRTGATFPAIVSAYWQRTFTFLAYPDRRYGAVGGTAALWIPASSMLQRRCHIALFLLPFYLAIWSGAVMGTALGAQTLHAAEADAILILPIPFFALVALNGPQIFRLRTPK